MTPPPDFLPRSRHAGRSGLDSYQLACWATAAGCTGLGAAVWVWHLSVPAVWAPVYFFFLAGFAAWDGLRSRGKHQ